MLLFFCYKSALPELWTALVSATAATALPVDATAEDLRSIANYRKDFSAFVEQFGWWAQKITFVAENCSVVSVNKSEGKNIPNYLF